MKMNEDELIRKTFEPLKNASIPDTEFFITRVMARLGEAGTPAQTCRWSAAWPPPPSQGLRTWQSVYI